MACQLDDYDEMMCPLKRKVPKEFLCPITSAFMEDPVYDPSLKVQGTYDRSSVSKTDEWAPDVHLRNKINTWLSRRIPCPAFAYMAEPAHIASAVNALVEQTRALTREEALQYLRQLKNKLLSKPELGSSAEVLAAVGRLLWICPEEHEQRKQWVKETIGMVAHVDEVTRDALGGVPMQLPELALACAELTDMEFQIGLVNLLHAFLVQAPDPSTSYAAVGYMPIVSWYSLSDAAHLVHPATRRKLSRLMLAMVDDVAEEFPSDPTFFQALLSFSEEIVEGHQENPLLTWQYWDTLRRIAAVDSATLVRVGLTRVALRWQVEIRTLQDSVQKDLTEEAILLVLCQVSRTSVGRLDIARLFSLWAPHVVTTFYVCLHRNRWNPMAVLSALETVLNVLKHSRYTAIYKEEYDVDGFTTAGEVLTRMAESEEMEMEIRDSVKELVKEISEVTENIQEEHRSTKVQY